MTNKSPPRSCGMRGDEFPQGKSNVSLTKKLRYLVGTIYDSCHKKLTLKPQCLKCLFFAHIKSDVKQAPLLHKVTTGPRMLPSLVVPCLQVNFRGTLKGEPKNGH